MLSGYFLTILIIIGIYIILALGLNIITGYAGQISLGHVAFFGIGAYCSALLSTKFGFSFWLALPLSILITALTGTLLGLPSLRVREDFLAITTIGINFVVQSIFLYVPFFGGALGLGGIPYPSIFGFEFTKFVFLLLIILMVIICIIISHWLANSWRGLALEAVREDEYAANVMGVNITKFKVLAFTIGSAYAGLGGSLYAHFMTFISPYDFGFPMSIVILSMVVFGGIGTIRGPIFGAVLLGIAPELFRPIMEYRMLMYGLLLVVMMRYQPNGLLGQDSYLWNKFSLLSKRILRGKIRNL